MEDKLKYVDEDDKVYGLTGVAISVVALDADSIIESLSLDDDESVEFSRYFEYVSNPRVSPRIVWNEMVKHFQVLTAMRIANMMCRNYVRHRRKLSSEIARLLKECNRRDGVDGYQLDADEADVIFDKNYNYFDRLFSYSQIHQSANEFAEVLRRQRKMTVSEIIDQLRAISSF